MDQLPRNDMLKMQREAEQRIREMRKKADMAVTGNDMPPVPNFVRLEQNKSEHSKNQPVRQQFLQKEKSDKPKQQLKSVEPKSKGFDILRMLNLKALHFDSDITLIIMLVLLLSAEESDELLLLALIYIML